MYRLLNCFLLAVLVADALPNTDSSFGLFVPEKGMEIPWQLNFIPADSTPRLSREAAFGGDFGITLANPTGNHFFLQSLLPYRDSFWVGFHIKFRRADSARWGNTGRGEPLFVMAVQNNTGKKPLDDFSGLRFRFNPLTKKPRMTLFVERSSPAGAHFVDSDLEWDRFHAVETYFELLKDSNKVKIETYLDGRAVDRSVGLLSNAGADIYSTVSAPPYSQPVDLDDFKVSRARQSPHPPKPAGLAFLREDGGRWRLIHSEQTPFYKDEIFVEARYLLFDHHYPSVPLFDGTTTHPSLLYRFLLPFSLDSGAYHWRVAIKNNFGLWGGWSAPCSLFQPIPVIRDVVIEEALVTPAGSTRPVSALKIGPWHTVKIKFRKHQWNKPSYLIVQMHHASYTLGHPGNKGGAFDPARNYIINLSVNGRTGDSVIFTLFEKNPYSVMSKKLLTPTDGIYIDNHPRTMKVDGANNTVTLNFRLLEQALEGEWFLSAHAVLANLADSTESLSNIYRKPMTVLNRGNGYARFFVPPVCLAVFLTLMFTFVRRRRAQRKMLNEYKQRLISYIDANLQNDINFDDIKGVLCSGGKVQCSRILRKLDIHSIPDFVNIRRIKKAQDLMRTTQKNISEISCEVGFNHVSYFTTVFKKYEKISPIQYKKSISDNL